LVKLVGNYATTSGEFKPMDFGRKAQYFTLDVISVAAFGKAFGYLATDGMSTTISRQLRRSFRLL
jgi:hypothetical protein